MNEFEKNKKIETLLEETVEQVQPNLMFKAELEEKLRKAHKPRVGLTWNFKGLLPALTSLGVFGALIVFMLWIFQSVGPQHGTATGEEFSCPVTLPNGSIPPGMEEEDPYSYGNGEIWTTLWPDGKVVMQDDNIEPDGSYAMKWLIFRGVEGALSIEGRRLDADAGPLRAFLSDGYGDHGLQIIALIFPTTGCWEVTARVGEASLTFVTEVVYGEATPEPNIEQLENPVITSTPNRDDSDNQDSGYDFRGGKLFLAQPLPQSPDSANVYMLQEYPPVTLEQVLALAEQFGLEGEVYTAPGRTPDTIDYVVTDGKQYLSISNAGSYFYTADLEKNNRGAIGRNIANADATIREFLAAHGIDFEYDLSADFYGNYLIHPVSEDGLPIQYEFISEPIMRVVLDEEGAVLRLDANLIRYDSTPLGSYAIITAEEALQAVLNGSPATGMMETMYAMSGEPPKEWRREYADGEQVTIYGGLSILPAVNAGEPTLFFIDGVPLNGNTGGLEAVENYVLVAASGQFVTENGIRKFMVDSWSRDVIPGFYSGTLRNEGGQIIFAFDDGSGAEYPLIDPPTDVPLNTPSPQSQLLVNGIVTDGKFDWKIIQYFADSSQMGGGGGGGGTGFYELNLSGTPIPFPTLETMPEPSLDTTNALTYVVQEGDTLAQIASMYGLTPEQLMQANGLTEATIFIGQSLVIPGTTAPPQLDGARGMVNITIYVRDDGSERIQYTFFSSDPQNPYMLLEGDGLEELLAHNNKPIRVWGSAERLSEYGIPVINVERYEVLFPDLQFQLLFGTEEVLQIEGRDVILLTTETGEKYIELGPNCSDAFGLESMSGKPDDVEKIQLEVLMIPDLTFGGYPAICVFSTGIASDKNGNSFGMEMTAAQPQRIPEPVFGTGNQPDFTIDSMELVYYASGPNYMIYNPNATERYRYMQPVWRILGTYETGEKLEIVIQALRPEFLAPNTVP